ncbi:hypothetical protein B0H10DRAFT_1370472 [Mycena sp. CBHHK59/15]|nr:hypothetical protein B0H10DRAFT_477351 [Mycena sp. CBHHK59/15]KAJ6616835.1 hypothetical protein B0H10DRAFT_1370472 [Mycena sp. CBHHK59/15]
MPPAFRLDGNLGLGITELGIFATLALFGILVLQVYIYYLSSVDDGSMLKCLVAAVLVLELCHTIAGSAAIYYWTVTLATVSEKPGSSYGLSLGMVFETLITLLVQAYFIHRVYRFSQNAFLGIALTVLCVLRFVGGLIISVESFLNLPREPDYFALQDRFAWLIMATFSVGAFVDVCIASALCVYVYKWKTVPAMKTTSQLIHKIMFWSIQTGLVTSLASVTVIACFQAMRRNYVWIGVFAILGKLYSNSLLASLNVRNLHRNNTRNMQSFAMFSDLMPDFAQYPSGLPQSASSFETQPASHPVQKELRRIPMVG